MDDKCKKYWQAGLPCRPGQLSPMPVDAVDTGACTTPSKTDGAGHGSIVFGTEHLEHVALIPGYNALAPMIRPVRDPALSLIAMSGVDPTGPVMVEVPLVLNNTTFSASMLLAGWRIGYAGQYVRGDHIEPVEHRAEMHTVFDILRQAGARLVEVDAQRGDDTFQFNLQTHNEIDELVTGHRLDALVSDGLSTAFHRACSSGYPSVCETLEDGTRFWFYGARWAGDRLTVLLRTYRQLIPALVPTSGAE